jgi:D-alanyl-D-alanine-carboxypeptidase/D-alanyl-D-alanine-endopeptidase
VARHRHPLELLAGQSFETYARLVRSAVPFAFIVALLFASCTSSTDEPTVTITISAPGTIIMPPVATASTTASTSPAETTTTIPPCGDLIAESIRDSVRSYVDEEANVGIVLGVVSPCGRDVFAYGSSALEGGRALDEDTVFEIGSTGKSFTGILLADMVQRNELSLSDPIEEYLPDDVTVPTYEGRSITLVDLATHTSGLPSLPDNLNPADELRPYADYTVDQMYEALSSVELLTPIGSQYQYSNFGMGVLGHILELRTGMSYEDLVISRIANVLGMPDTRATLTPDMESRLALGYRDKVVFPLWDNPTLAGAGELRSTVRDLLTYLAANLGLEESSLYDAMQLSHQRFHRADNVYGVGLGWHIGQRSYGDVVEEHGATGGYWCFVGFLESKQVGVVVLTNTFNSVDQIGLDVLAGS